MGELLGALGLAWPRLLIYPGGVFALAAGWLLARWLSWCAGRPAPAVGRPAQIDIINIVPPLTAMTLLPLAPAQSFPYGLDLMVAVGLLEWPRLRALLGPSGGPWGSGGRRDELAGVGAKQGGAGAGCGPWREDLARSYAPLLLAALCMAEGAGGMELSGLLSWPEAWHDRALLVAGAGLWLAALPRLLEGPPHGLVGQLRALGLLLVGALPLIGAMGAWGALVAIALVSARLRLASASARLCSLW